MSYTTTSDQGFYVHIHNVYKKPLKGLYLISTPIGNSYDISLRALATMQLVDKLYVEDTRVTGKLLQMYGLKKQMSSYHDHSGDMQTESIIQELKEGKSIGLASDAGTPLIHDPGFELVRRSLEVGVPVTGVPGPSAVINALVISGLPCQQFQFCGFVPPKSGARKQHYAQFASSKQTLVFYETGPRLLESLQDMREVMGRRDIAITREMTKMHEQVQRVNLADLDKKEFELRGEFAIVVQGALQADKLSEEELTSLLEGLLKNNSLKQASRIIADTQGLTRQEVYEMGLVLQGKKSR